MSRNAHFVRPATTLHREPDGSAEVVTEARMGDAARILSTRGRWARIETVHDGYPGWAPLKSLRAGRWPAAGRIVRVCSLFANLHAGAGVRTPLSCVLALGTPLVRWVPTQRDLAGRSGDRRVRRGGRDGWLMVAGPGGLRGFIQPGDVCPGRSAWPPSRKSLVGWARKLLGLPYRWGGTTTFGMDCSGMVQMLYRLHGIDLPRDAHQQLAWKGLSPVDRRAVGPGDLLFFANARHVGMAVGRETFIHATAWRVPVVQKSRIDEPRWRRLRHAIMHVPTPRQ